MPGLLWSPQCVNQGNFEFGVNRTGKYELFYFGLSVAIMAELSSVVSIILAFRYEESLTPVIAENGRCGGTAQAPRRCTRRAPRGARGWSPCAELRKSETPSAA